MRGNHVPPNEKRHTKKQKGMQKHPWNIKIFEKYLKKASKIILIKYFF
jgi:hypothetical protein